jgi:hypothetical protein
MGAKITITGTVSKIRKVSINSEQKKRKGKVNINCLEIITGGSPNAPKGLPAASQIHFTVLCNDKQFNKLKKELDEHNLSLKNSSILVQGELNLDQPLSLVEGDIGVIAFQLQSLDVMKLEREQEKTAEETAATTENTPKQEKGQEKEQGKESNSELENKPKVLPLSQIFIPEAIRATRPRAEKLINFIKFYKEHGYFDKNVKVKQDNNKGWMLIDGYARFVAAEELGLNEIIIDVE